MDEMNETNHPCSCVATI